MCMNVDKSLKRTVFLIIFIYFYALTQIQLCHYDIKLSRNKQRMPRVIVHPINFQEFDEEIQLDVQATTNLAELYDALVDRLLAEYDLECNFEIRQVVFYQRANPNKKIAPTSKIQNLTATKKELCIIFPKDNRPIIECQFGGSDYFIYDYTKNDRLEMVLKKLKGPLSSAIQQQTFDRLVINGVEVNFSKDKNQKFQRFMEGSINSTIKIALFQQKSEGSVKNQRVEAKQEAHRKQSQQQLSPNKEINGIKGVHQSVEVKVETIPQQLNIGKGKQSFGPNKPPEVKVQVPSRPQPPRQKTVQQFLKKEESNNINNIQLLLKFEAISGNGGRRQVTLDVDRSKSMEYHLPMIINYIKSNGFDWDTDEYDHQRDRDKLHIIYQSSEFKKFDKSLKSLVQKETTQLIFNIERHYAGG